MTWLLKLFTKGGGQLKKEALSHVHDALRHCPDAQAIINCTGLQARYLGGVKDLKVFPTRGQVVVINAPHIKKTLSQISMHFSEAQNSNLCGNTLLTLHLQLETKPRM